MTSSLFQEKKHALPGLPLDFIPVRRANPALWETRRSILYDQLSHQARLCATEILKTQKQPASTLQERAITKVIWETVSSEIFYTQNKDDEGNFAFVLNDGKNSSVFLKKEEILRLAVVAKTTIALPFDKQGRFFYLPSSRTAPSEKKAPLRWKGLASFYNRLEEKQKKYTIPKIPIGSWKTPLIPPAWAPCPFKKAEDAFLGTTPPHVAAWCLERMHGRVFVELSPWNPEEERRIRELHRNTVHAFRHRAIKALVKKWGKSIPSETILAFFEKEDAIAERGETTVYNVHHKKPVSWGGNNQHRVYVTRDFHSSFHQDNDQTVGRICSCLQDGVYRIADHDELRDFLSERPQCLTALRKIPHVSIDDDGHLKIAILWPQESFCVPSLLHFEYRYKGIYGPEDWDKKETPNPNAYPKIKNPLHTALDPT